MAKSSHDKSQLCLNFDSVENRKVNSNVVQFETKLKRKPPSNNKNKAAFDKILEQANKLTW